MNNYPPRTSARVLVTGSTEGVGRATARALLDDGHHVAVHARTAARQAAVEDLVDDGAEMIIGDLAHTDQVNDLIDQADRLGGFDAVIHNAGVISGSPVLAVNVVAPYMMTVGLERPARLIYLSSGMHRSGRPDLTDVDWSGTQATRSYSDSKLFVTTLMAAVARHWPEVASHAVDPGWVPTRMGGPSASDDLDLAHVTQTWLATTNDPEASVSGRYWFHQQTEDPHPAVHDTAFQDELLDSLAGVTGLVVEPHQPNLNQPNPRTTG